MLWTRTVGGAAGLDDRGWDIVVDSRSDAIVTGVALNADGTADFLTCKLDGSDGSVIWSRSLPGAGTNLEERTQWLVPCEGGDVVLGAKIWTQATSYDVLLHRFASEDGETVFHEQYGADGAVADNPRGMARDAAGNLLVAGVRRGDFMVLKFSGADGGILWDSVYDGPPGWYDAANAVIEGPGGIVVAGGYRTGEETSWDAAVVGFDAADGAILWERSFDAGTGQADEISLLAAGPEEIYAIGYAYAPDTDCDLLSLRYGFEGSALAEDPAAEADRPRTLSIGPNPVRAGTMIRFGAPVPGPVRLALFGADGRRILDLASRPRAEGMSQIWWDGRDRRGGRLPPGAYFLRLDHPGGSETGRIVLVE